MDNDYIINNIEASIFRQVQGLDYNGELIPDVTRLKQLELIVLTIDYSDYVQECWEKGIRPATCDEFIQMWNLLFNANLYNSKVGDVIYYNNDDCNLVKTTIKKIWTENDGLVCCNVTCINRELNAGDLYTKNTRWGE